MPAGSPQSLNTFAREGPGGDEGHSRDDNHSQDHDARQDVLHLPSNSTSWACVRHVWQTDVVQWYGGQLVWGGRGEGGA